MSVIVITSPKGGAGKSTAAVLRGTELAQNLIKYFIASERQAEFDKEGGSTPVPRITCPYQLNGEGEDLP